MAVEIIEEAINDPNWRLCLERKEQISDTGKLRDLSDLQPDLGEARRRSRFERQVIYILDLINFGGYDSPLWKKQSELWAGNSLYMLTIFRKSNS